MIIAVNTRFLLDDYLEGYGNFLYETFTRITKNYPEHQFIFIFDRPFDKSYLFNDNVRAVITGPPARHPVLWKYWYDWRVPAVLRKYKADVFVSADGFCSLRTKVPQCLVIHDLAFLRFPSFLKRSHLIFYKRYVPRFFARASSVCTVSEFSKNDIEKSYGPHRAGIDIVYGAAKDNFRQLTPSEKSAIKEKYTAGKEYFIYTGAIHPRKNLMNLLKAFSLFKKRQQSAMKLVLVGRLAWKYESFSEKLKSYKYRDDVVMTGYVAESELIQLTGSAYGMVYPSFFEGFGLPVIEAMKAGVPVITSSGSVMQEIAGEAALYADPAQPADIAAQMMYLYKDETRRNEMVRAGREIAAQYNWNRTADLLWECIMKAVAQPDSKAKR